MTSQTGRNLHGWLRAVMGGLAGGALAASLVAGLGVSTAFADPEDPTTEAPIPAAEGPRTPCTGDDCNNDEPQATMTADQALAIIAADYDMGEGGGQLSKLIDDVMRLRAQGFRPSNANRLAIEEALEHRPNQVPLVEALKATLAYQRKLQRQSQASVQGPAPVVLGGPTSGPMPGAPPGVVMPVG